MTTTVPNILLFGETGAGKSSLLNMIAGRQITKVSADAKGTTFKNASYTVDLEGRTVNIFDTTGLNEGKKGTVSPKDAVKHLYQLMRDLHDGLNLLVYCVRGPRIKDTTIVNYQLFYTKLCSKQVPIVIVITGLENEDPMESWWETNKGEFEKQGMESNGHACVTTTKGKRDIYAREYQESEIVVRRIIEQTMLTDPWKMDTKSWFVSVAESFTQPFGWAMNTINGAIQNALRDDQNPSSPDKTKYGKRSKAKGKPNKARTIGSGAPASNMVANDTQNRADLTGAPSQSTYKNANAGESANALSKGQAMASREAPKKSKRRSGILGILCCMRSSQFDAD